MAIRWGIVSAGKISNDFVVALRTLPETEHKIVAVAARDVNQARDFASIHSIAKYYGSYEELSKDPDVEVVYVGCITSQHFRVGKLMLENGKHVLMEKPMTLNTQQTKTLGDIAQRNKRFLMEALWSRFLPSYGHLMDLIQKKTIGDIVHVQANLGFPLMHLESIAKKASGGGTLLSLGIYPLNAVAMIYGSERPTEITAAGRLNEDGVDAAMTCFLKFSNNRTASVATNGMVELPSDLLVIGTQGIIKVPYSMYAATRIETKGEVFEFPLSSQSKVPTYFPNSSGLKFEAMEVRKCILNGKLESEIMPLKDSIHLAEIMDEIRGQLGVIYLNEE